MEKINEVVDNIIQSLEKRNWSQAERLQLVLEQLVMIEVASIKGMTTQFNSKGDSDE